MEYLEIKDNIIIGHYCGQLPEQTPPEVEYKVVTGCAVNIGDDVRMYEDVITGKKKNLKKLIDENLVQIPEGKKLNEAGMAFEDLTEAEKVQAGLRVLKEDEKIENGYVVQKTKKELYDEGKLSKEEYNAYIDELRQFAYYEEADPLGMQVLRGELEKSVWLEKIAEIKAFYPKVTE